VREHSGQAPHASGLVNQAEQLEAIFGAQPDGISYQRTRYYRTHKRLAGLPWSVTQGKDMSGRSRSDLSRAPLYLF
jgi:hypothetical protein